MASCAAPATRCRARGRLPVRQGGGECGIGAACRGLHERQSAVMETDRRRAGFIPSQRKISAATPDIAVSGAVVFARLDALGAQLTRAVTLEQGLGGVDQRKTRAR